MKNLIIKTIVFVAFSLSTTKAQTVNFDWAKSVGGTSDDYGNSVVTDKYGHVYVTGGFRDTVDFDPGSGVFKLISKGYDDMFIMKLNSAGNFVWAKQIAGDYLNEIGYSITLDTLCNVYVTGVFSDTVDFNPGVGTFTLSSSNGEGFILKLDSLGNFIWTKQLPDNASSIALDPAGNIYTTGTFFGPGDFDPGPGTFTMNTVASSPDVFVCKLNPSGNFVWARSMGGNAADAPRSIDVDASGNVYTTGYFQNTADFDPGVGFFNLNVSGGSYGAFISKLSSTGNFAWAKEITGTGVVYNDGHSIAVDASGNVYAGGEFISTNADFDPGPSTYTLNAANGRGYVLKLTSAGNFVWAIQTAGSVESLTCDAASNVYMTGIFVSGYDFDPGPSTYTLSSADGRIYICKLNSPGTLSWVKQIGGNSIDVGNSICLDANSNIYTSGQYYNSPDFDPGTAIYSLTSNGGSETFIHKMSQSGVGIKEIDLEYNVKIFPNPTTGEVTFISKTEKTSVKLIDVTGKILFEKENIFQEQFTIDISEQPSGVYILEVHSNKYISQTKLIKN